MASITYNQIYSRFLSMTEAYDLKSMVDSDAYELMEEWLHSVKALPKVRKLFNSLATDDELMELTYELKYIDDTTDDDEDFVIELFALGISIKWVKPKYYSSLNTSQVYGSSESKFYSQANHADALNTMYNSSQKDLQQLIKTHSYINNSYLKGDD